MRIRFYILLFFIAHWATAQVNLVLNPSFEQIDSCPSYWNQINRAKFWGNLSNDPLKAACWGELMHTCCTNTFYCGVPISGNIATSITDYQVPRTGNAMCQIETYVNGGGGFSNFRVYVKGTLRETLVNGVNYCGKLYITLANLSAYKTNRFGMYFDNGTLLGSQDECYVLNAASHIENSTSVIISDTLGWMKIEGNYISNGTENFVTIGSFYNDLNTTKIATNFNTGVASAVYRIDDVSLIPITTKAYAGNDQTLCLGDSITLGRPQEIGLECLWYTPGNPTPFSSNSDITFKPTAIGSYTLVQKMDNCVVSLDTVVVTVVDDCEFTSDAPNVFTPNEDDINDVWKVNTGKYSGSISCTVFNRWGIKVHEHSPETATIIQWDGRTTSGEKCSDGVYYYVLQYTDKKGDIQKKNGYVSLFR